jgi:hypothetical protein
MYEETRKSRQPTKKCTWQREDIHTLLQHTILTRC